MAVKKKGLGRGLDALFPEKSVKPAEKKQSKSQLPQMKAYISRKKVL
ncbi:MAG: hypothetical protein ACLTZM_26585 [Ruminococcus sp.]